ncbi:hypothetical protein [Bacillus atrophaeus]|uniref:hypothetical protein n=1 Tax=Bacillus atrophaeus TaxID=1452 RepID=UPI001C63334A|nr:hypothetical protein [Bacillus atrophaeus]QYG89401.1 hypothetical protein HCU65_13455 [Bacillus atrophaeus]
MIEKYTTEVSLDFFIGDETDLKDTIEEIRLFAKTYENDKVTVLSVTENESSKGKNYKVLLQHERDTDNLGRKYEYDEEELFGFFEDEE